MTADGAADAEARLVLGAFAWAGGHGPDLAGAAGAVRRWPALLRRAAHRGFLETLVHALLASGAAAALPGDVRRTVQEVEERAAAQNLLLLAESARLQRLLEERGIPSAALKGVALLAAHYPAPGARHVADLDLLVPPDRLGEAQAAVGGEAVERPPTLEVGGPEIESEVHAWPVQTAAGVLCELHVGLPGFSGPEAAARVLATARSVPLQGGRSLRIPQPADCAAIAAVHALVHHGPAPLRYLPRLAADLCALEATAGLDWQAVRAAAGPGGAAAVDAARALLDEVRAGRVAGVFPGRSAALREGMRTLLLDAGAGMRGLFPSRRFMAWRYGLPERSPRLLLYYLARPALALRDRLRQ